MFLIITIVGVVGIATCEDPPAHAAAAAADAAANDDDSLELVAKSSDSSSSSPATAPMLFGLSSRVAGTLMFEFRAFALCCIL